MICPKCQAVVEDGVDFCPFCGENLVNQETQKQEKNAEGFKVEPVDEELEIQQTEVAKDFATADFSEPEKSKKKKFKKILIPLVAVIAAIGVAVGVFFDAISGFVLRNVGSAESYFKYVEKKAIQNFAADISEYYGALEVAYTSETKATSGTGEISFTVDDQISSILGESVDLSMLKDIKLGFETSYDNESLAMAFDAIISDTSVVGYEVFVDLINSNVIMGLPGISDKYFSNSETFDYDMQSNPVYNLLSDSNFYKSAPSKAELEELLTKYLTIAIDNIDDVERSRKTVSVDGVKEDVIVLEFELDMRTCVKIAKAILKEAKKDSQIKSYIKDMVKYLQKQELIDDDMSASEFYDSYKEAVEELIDELNDYEYENFDMLIWTDYVNSKHEVVGRSFEVSEDGDDFEKIFSYLTVKDGDNFASKFEISDTAVITGKGTNKDNVKNAKYSLKIEDTNYLEIVVEDLNVANYKDGKLSGKFVIEPTKAFYNEMELDSDISSVVSLMSPGLEIDFNITKEKGDLAVNITSNGKALLGIKMAIKTQNIQKVEMPDESDIVYDIDEWMQSFDFTAFIDNLRNAGLPEEIIQMLELSMAGDDYYGEYAEDLDDMLESDYDDYFDEYDFEF